MENLFSRHMNDFKKKELLRCSEIEVMIKNDICQTFNFNFFLKKKQCLLKHFTFSICYYKNFYSIESLSRYCNQLKEKCQFYM